MKKNWWVRNLRRACVSAQRPHCGTGEATPEDLRRKLVIIRECGSWVCEYALWEHEWVTELNVILKENELLEALNSDLGVP